MSTAPVRDDEVPPARRYKWPKLAWLALAVLAVGIGLFFFGGSDQVESIRVSQTGLAIPNIVSSPDFSVSLMLKDDTVIETPAYEDVAIGGGLSFDLTESVALSSIAQVVLYDMDTFSPDDMLDRADVASRQCNGQSYTFELQGSQAPAVTVGMVLMALGSLCLAYIVIAFIRAHAI
jgi:hypothetical protein